MKYELHVIVNQIDSSTIDGNIVFVQCTLSSVNSVFVTNSDNFRIMCLSYCKINAILFSVFTLFYLILENMSTNVRKFRFVIFDTCDVVYNWSISLLPPIVLDNLFDLDECIQVNLTIVGFII